MILNTNNKFEMSNPCSDSKIIGDSKEDVVITKLNELVESLYSLKDNFYENHSIEEAENKNKIINEQLEKVLKKFEEHKNIEPKSRTWYYYLLGRALNVSPVYNVKAEEVLSKAIKLDVKMYQAWNELGESYWKKEDILEAKNCFLGALKHSRNKTSLRNLSMVLRMEKTSSFEERSKNVEEGMRCAKEAVELDPKDGTSWSVLGNAYLSSFFTISQNPSVLNLCKSAYAQAEKDSIAKSNPDLHYNKAIVAKYEEDYLSALNSFELACRLEPSWSEPKQKQIQLLSYLSRVDELIKNKGKNNKKKLLKLINNINPDKNLGPYQGGKYKAKNGQEITLTHVEFSDISDGLNEEKVILGCVLCSIQDEDNVPFTFVMVDRTKTCIAVTVYNLTQGKGVLIGDYVSIPEPYLTSVNITYDNKEFHFNSVRIVSPLVMVVNGKKVDKSKQSGLQFKTFAMAE